MLIIVSDCLYNQWKKGDKVEDEYLKIKQQYTSAEIKQLGQLLIITVKALLEKEHDFLGEVFSLGKLTNKEYGQYVTPFYVAKFIAESAISQSNYKKGKYLHIIDPCCGAGTFLIAADVALKERGINYQKDVFFKGTDIDHRCARMAFIQLSLLGIPAIIVCGNTLTEKIFWQRETAGFYISGMNYRLNREKNNE